MSTNMTLIETKTVGSGGSASISFTNIPQTYTDLKIVMSTRSTRNAFDDEVKININGTGIGTNFTSRVLGGEGSGGTQFSTSYSTGRITLGIQGSTTTASTFTSTEHYFPNYTGSNFKSISSDNTVEQNATAVFTDLSASLYSSTSPITSIAFSTTLGTFAEGSTFYLYGISNVTSTTKATGGIVSSDGTYNYHMFPFSGTFTPTQNITVDYLVIAGGGGGGSLGGGGGAGGLRSTVGTTGGGGSLESALSLTANTGYTVTVGAGGAGGSASGAGVAGSNSVFSTITSTGGGRGGGDGVASTSGGSGGGGGNAGASAAGTANQGYAGGGTASASAGSGGGGAGAVGSNAATTISAGASGGNGGAGVAISAFANATQTGLNTYYAGGGAGGARKDTGGDFASGTGGLGGGGNGGSAGNTTPAVGGIINTGSGGGGGGYNGSAYAGAAGGSGLVIIRYAI